jgi:hypothetical protein
MIREIALALVGPITLSLWGAIYFGYRHSPLFSARSTGSERELSASGSTRGCLRFEALSWVCGVSCHGRESHRHTRTSH